MKTTPKYQALFVQYAKATRKLDTPIGDFAGDIFRDPTFPWGESTTVQYAYVWERVDGVVLEAARAFFSGARKFITLGGGNV